MAKEYPSNLMELVGWGATAITFTFYKRPNSTTSTRDVDLGFDQVSMPVPKNLENPMDISWEQTELGATGNAIVKGNTDSLSSGGIITNMLEGVGAKLAGISGYDEGKAKAVMGASGREIANPYIAMTFKSIGFRKFSMEFKFSPHNVGECEDIDLIVKKFRKTALPYDRGPRIGYPGEIDIRYYNPNGTWLPRFKRSVITDVQVSYSGQGHFATMDNGFPAETVLNIKFTENELVWRKDVTAGGESY